MKKIVAIVFVSLILAGTAGAGEEKAVFGPVKYDVKERYGVNNVYADKFKAGEGVYVFRFQLGDQLQSHPEFLEFSLNGTKLLRYEKYEYPNLACIAKIPKENPLQKENYLQVSVKDSEPSGFKRPPLPPRFVTLSAVPYAGKLPPACYGILGGWEVLDDVQNLFLKISNRESAAFAIASINLSRDVASRAEAMRSLADRKDESALPFIISVFSNLQYEPDVRGEAAIGIGMLGDKASIPLLIGGVLDPDEKTRLGSARALSLFQEEDTREPFMKAIERLDGMRREAVVESIINAGWKPVGALITMAQSKDPHISRTAVSLLGSTGDPRATDVLLKLLEDPGHRDVKAIIIALGETHDPRARASLSTLAKDRTKRKGKEGEIALALAELGDQQSAPVIEDMIRNSENRSGRSQMLQAYKKLTGRDFK